MCDFCDDKNEVTFAFSRPGIAPRLTKIECPKCKCDKFIYEEKFGMCQGKHDRRVKSCTFCDGFGNKG